MTEAIFGSIAWFRIVDHDGVILTRFNRRLRWV